MQSYLNLSVYSPQPKLLTKVNHNTAPMYKGIIEAAAIILRISKLFEVVSGYLNASPTQKAALRQVNK